MNNKKIIDEISSKIQTMVNTQLHELCKLDIDRAPFIEVELFIRQKVQEIGRELLEQSIPLLYGTGHIGGHYYDDDGNKCICMLKENSRDFLSTFGKITFKRACYHNPADGDTYGLLDFKLNIQNKVKTSPLLKYFSGILSINMPFKESSTILSKLININLSPSKNDDFLEQKGKLRNDVYENKISKIEHDSDGRIPKANINCNNKKFKRTVYLETDGCHIPVLDGWNECKTFILFETEKIKNKKTGKEIIKLKNRKYYSTMNKVVAFKKQLKVAIEEYCGNEDVRIVCVGDGADWIWKMAKQLFSNNVIEILDWYHIDENICEFSSKIYIDDETKKEEFQNDMKELLYDGKIDDAIKYLNELHDKIPKTTIPDLYLILGYIKNNETKMNYRKYKEEMGLIIGSGTIESANKHVIQRRMKLSGIRWKFKHANHIAQLRADYANGDFDKLYGVRNNFQFANNSENEIKMVN